MVLNAFSSPNRKPSRRASRRGVKAVASTTKPRGILAVDTSFSRHRARSPELLYQSPYESTTEQHEVQPSGAAGVQTRPYGRPTNCPQVAMSNNTTSDAIINGLPAHPDVYRSQVSGHNIKSEQNLAAPAYHKRIQGLRPSPLDLTDISPADRAITIGIEIPADSPHQPATPKILITPAREDFADCNLATQAALLRGQRAASSVYSSAPYTADFEKTPPVPPLPLFAMQHQVRPMPQRTKTVSESLGAVVEDNSAGARSQKATLSVCTLFEEDDGDADMPTVSSKSVNRSLSRRFTTRSQLPTPRLSRGWWNVITSPFSAGTNGHFWRSPVAYDAERTPILGGESHMSASRRSSSESDGDYADQPRSAPVKLDRAVPLRSATAPAALSDSTPRVDIYRIPSQGEAAAYYDLSKHYPSVLLERGPASPLSALNDVCACERHNHGLSRSADDGTAKTTKPDDKDYATCACSKPPVSRNSLEAVSRGPPVFATPTVDELGSSTPPRPIQQRSATHDTVASQASVLSTTPVMQYAHLAAVMGPRSTRGETKAVTVGSSRPPSLPAQTEPDATPTFIASLVKPRFDHSARPVQHSRNDSFGLGITGSQKEAFPAPKPLSEKPRLGTDRYGQLRIITNFDTPPKRPFHRRFFWTLAAIASSLLLLLIILLCILVPQKHNDTPVQAQWLNLTAFPALPTGVTTIVQPAVKRQENGCVAQSELWTCNQQPNFRVEIRFRNRTTASVNSTSLRSDLVKRSGSLSARSAIQRRDAWAQKLWTPSPAAPSEADQLFLGNTTDNTTFPYNGEETPFYLSLLDPVVLTKRQESPYPYPTTSVSSTNNTTAAASATPTRAVPKPLTLSNGLAAPDVLHPYAQAQPLRLYNRGLETEHYGFYTYFDRSLTVSPTSALGLGNASSALCTWAQTRLHIQIWTRRDASTASSSKDTTTAVLGTDSTVVVGVAAINSTANDFTGRGSFPYSATVVLERHGGEAGEKGIYCYGLDEEGMVTGKGGWVDEDRGFGGAIVSAAAVPGGLRKRAEVGEGADGGSGGCACEWENWS